MRGYRDVAQQLTVVGPWVQREMGWNRHWGCRGGAVASKANLKDHRSQTLPSMCQADMQDMFRTELRSPGDLRREGFPSPGVPK